MQLAMHHYATITSVTSSSNQLTVHAGGEIPDHNICFSTCGHLSVYEQGKFSDFPPFPELLGLMIGLRRQDGIRALY